MIQDKNCSLSIKLTFLSSALYDHHDIRGSDLSLTFSQIAVLEVDFCLTESVLYPTFVYCNLALRSWDM